MTAASPSPRKRPRRRLLPWAAGALAFVLAGALAPQAFASSDPASLAGAAAGRQAVAGAVRAGNFLGVTFGFPSDTLSGNVFNDGDSTVYNYPMYLTDGNQAHFWDAYVEQLQTAGVDFVAPTVRGIVPGKPQFNGGGDTPLLADLAAAIQRRGANLKISALDDTAYSLTTMKNLDKHNSRSYTPLFDVGDVNGTGEGGYKYFWDNNLKLWFQAVPANLRFTINNQPVIYEWSLSDAFFTNQGNGHSAAMLNYVKQQAQAQFGQTPFFIVDNTWIKEDPAVAGVVGGVDNWFTMANSWTLASLNGNTFGALAPSFNTGSGSTLRDIEPDHGNTLRTGLANTVGKGALVTLVEGFSDWKENAALWRGRPGAYAATRYDYPNQMINILRSWSRDPFPTGTRIEAEGADSYSDTTAGNAWNLYRSGDIDVETTADGGPGWAVGNTAAGEWLQWQEIPLSGAVTLKVRVATVTANQKIRIDVDGATGPTTTLPNTGGWQTYQTVNAGTFTLAANSVHTVRITFLTGGLNLNYWSN